MSITSAILLFAKYLAALSGRIACVHTGKAAPGHVRLGWQGTRESVPQQRVRLRTPQSSLRRASLWHLWTGQELASQLTAVAHARSTSILPTSRYSGPLPYTW